MCVCVKSVFEIIFSVDVAYWPEDVVITHNTQSTDGDWWCWWFRWKLFVLFFFVSFALTFLFPPTFTWTRKLGQIQFNCKHRFRLISFQSFVEIQSFLFFVQWLKWPLIGEFLQVFLVLKCALMDQMDPIDFPTWSHTCNYRFVFAHLPSLFWKQFSLAKSSIRCCSQSITFPLFSVNSLRHPVLNFVAASFVHIEFSVPINWF